MKFIRKTLLKVAVLNRSRKEAAPFLENPAHSLLTAKSKRKRIF